MKKRYRRKAWYLDEDILIEGYTSKGYFYPNPGIQCGFDMQKFNKKMIGNFVFYDLSLTKSVCENGIEIVTNYKRLSSMISINEWREHIENEVWDETVIIDKGFFLEIYINPDGVYGNKEGEHSSEGYSLFRYINRDISLKNFLNLELFDEGSLQDSTMTINVIPSQDVEFSMERKLCVNLLKRGLNER